ncbi:MAG: hypothetical protein SPL56_09325 [Lachnospiraceae bacterium]|nr:hypothetical protein [Lachnospiraceae bacterium]
MDPYERLANAVVKQAVDDWRLAVKKLKRRKRNQEAQRIKEDAEEFFLSERFLCYTSLDGKMLLQKLREEAKI